MTAAALPDKWIDGLDAQASVFDAARAVLALRIRAVAKMTHALIETKARDDETVHQLRVATRRGEAAVLAFKPWMRKSQRKPLQKLLKRLRTSAGEVRDRDVQSQHLREGVSQATAETRAAIEHALVAWSMHRQSALHDLLREARLARKRLPRTSKRLLRSPTKSGDSSPAPNLQVAGQHSLEDLARAFVEQANADLRERENLHALRVRGKRLRYALEVFGSSAHQPNMLPTLSNELVTLQDRLGAINDEHELAERLRADAAVVTDIQRQAQASEPSPLGEALTNLAGNFDARCDERVQSFLEWWTTADASDFRMRVEALAQPRPPMRNEPALESPVPEIVVQVSSNGAIGSRDHDESRQMESETPSGP